MIEGNPSDDEARAGVSCQHRAFDTECVEERGHVGREVFDPVPGLGLVGVAVSALGHRDGTYVRRQPIEDRLVGAPGVSRSRDQQNDRIRNPALVGAFQLEARLRDGQWARHREERSEIRDAPQVPVDGIRYRPGINK